MRRDLLRVAGAGLVMVSAVSMAVRRADATPQDVRSILSDRFGDRTYTEGRIELELPEIACRCPCRSTAR